MSLEKKAPPFFISGGILVCFLAFSSYVDLPLRLVKSTWFLMGDRVQYLWDSFLDVVGEDVFAIWAVGTFLILTVEYWVVGAVYTYLDLTLKPEGLRKYKVQPGTNEPITIDKLIKLSKRVLFNQIVVGIPSIYLGGKLYMWRGPPPIRQLPKFHEIILHYLFCLLVEEVAYYHIHRLLHYKYFYKYIHKIHHEWKSPVAISAIYCHPLEQFFANFLPAYLGPFIVGAQLFEFLLWFALTVLFTLAEHSGYHLPFLTSSEFHDYHHYSFNNNFGFLGIFDRLNKTSIQYFNSKSSKRHFILTGLKSAREIVPDDVPDKKRR